MTTDWLNRHALRTLPLLAAMLAPGLTAQTSQAKRTAYFPAAATWQHKAPAEMGMDAAKLREAVDWAEAHGSKWDFEKDQVRLFGKVLGALPAQRAATNGIILRHGYIVAEFGDTTTSDPVGVEEYGSGQMKPREIHDPGTYYEYNDVRNNRLALSLARVFGKGLPDVLREKIMDQIGASREWTWHGYGPRSTVEIDGKPVESVSGGTRWGGGLWINSQDLARFGLLILNRGNWEGKQLVSEKWIREATTPSAHGPDYGYLWWLNTRQKEWPSGPASSFAAVGGGGNILWIDPEHDIVLVWHWYEPGKALDGMIQRIVASITRA